MFSITYSKLEKVVVPFPISMVQLLFPVSVQISDSE
jgi:hypothetical protein